MSLNRDSQEPAHGAQWEPLDHPIDRPPDLRSRTLTSRTRTARGRRRIPVFLLCAVVGLVVLVWSRSSAARKPRGAKGTLLSSSSYPFTPPDDPLPVHHLESLMLYHNTPVARSRPPPTQFLLDPRADLSKPVVALITATNNPRDVMRETATTLFGQSLQNFVWVIVDDHTTEPGSRDLLDELARDPRVVVVKNERDMGLAVSRNVALDWVFEHYDPPPKYLVSLDDDDLFEYTAFEKTCWMLESNPEWDIGGFRYIKWGASNETVVTGLHSGRSNWSKGNFVPNAAVYTSRALQLSGCRYNEEEFHDGGEDWDFWMCLADAGLWGGTILEPLYWYRVNDPTFRTKRWGNTFVDGFEQLKRHIWRKHPTLDKAFPVMKPKRNIQLEPVAWEPPFEQALARTDKQIMFILPWLYMGGADIGALHMIQLYALAGYRVTVVCTLSKVPEGIELRPFALQYTHDIHILPTFLRMHDFPRYIKHLVDSRGIRQVILSNSQLAYEMLPALAEQMPDVEWIDYLHNEAYDGWKSGGYPRYSIIMQRYLARSITCSHYLRGWLVDNGHLDANRIGVVKLGIEASEFKPATPAARNAAKATLLSVEPETFVIVVVGRLDPQKRSTLIPLIVEELIRRTETDFLVVMLGEGPMRRQLEAAIAAASLGDFVRLLGTHNDLSGYYAAADMFLLPSMSEGISIAVAEAMASGLPIVTARAGALPEQLGELNAAGNKVHDANELGGILVDHELDTVHDPVHYADAVEKLMLDPGLRARLGRNARRLVEDGFDWRTTLSGLFVETARAKNLPGHVTGDTRYPLPAAYLSTQMVLAEMWKETDMRGYYP